MKRNKGKAFGYRSGFELDFHLVFPEFKYEPEKFPYQVNEVRHYTPDFIDDEGMWYELKGRFTSADRKKMKAVQRSYPFQEITLVFQAPYNKLTKAKGSMTYAEWAEKNGFYWCTLESLADEKR